MIATHEVDDVAHWLASPKREEVFAGVATNITTFVHPSDSNRVALSMDVADMDAFDAYGAVVHVTNIAGLSGFSWTAAPLKWQALDIVYLVLNVIVAIGLVFGWRAGYFAFYVAAISQLFLYTVFRAWIVDVPEEFARTPEQVKYLDGLVVFHLVTILLVSLSIWLQRSSMPTTSA